MDARTQCAIKYQERMRAQLHSAVLDEHTKRAAMELVGKVLTTSQGVKEEVLVRCGLSQNKVQIQANISLSEDELR